MSENNSAEAAPGIRMDFYLNVRDLIAQPDGQRKLALAFTRMADERDKAEDAARAASAQIAEIHAVLDWFETARDAANTQADLAMLNGLAMFKVALLIGHEWKEKEATPCDMGGSTS